MYLLTNKFLMNILWGDIENYVDILFFISFLCVYFNIHWWFSAESVITKCVELLPMVIFYILIFSTFIAWPSTIR